MTELCDERTEWLEEKATRSQGVIEEDEDSWVRERYAAEAEQAIQEKALASDRFEKSAYRWRVATFGLVVWLLLVVVVVAIRTFSIEYVLTRFGAKGDNSSPKVKAAEKDAN